MINEELIDLNELSLRALQSVQNEEEIDAAAVKAALNQLSNPEQFAAAAAAGAATPASYEAAEEGAAVKSGAATAAQASCETAASEMEKAPLSVGEREYLQNIRERLLVLFTALQDDDGERYGQITVEFLEFLLASIEARLGNK